MKKIKKQVKGITLMALVVTIIVLLILAAVTINLVKNGGIITQAQNAAKMSRLASTREQISMDILAAQIEGSTKGEELTDEQIKDIVDKYGKLDEDGDTIKTDDGDLSLKDILDGNNDIPEDQKKKIAELENTIKELEQTIDNLNKQLEDEKNNKQELEGEIANLRKELEDKQTEIDDLNREITEKNEEIENKNQIISQLEQTVETLNNTIETLNTQIADLKNKQAVGNATVADVLTGKTFSNSSGVGLTGTMPSYTSGNTAVTTAGKWGFDTTHGPWLYVPNNAYYGTGHFFNIPWNTIKGNLGDAAAGNVLTGKTFTSTNGIKVAGTMPNRGNLNWSGSNTTYTVPAGYYSGGTLDSRPSYTNGYNAGVAAADARPNASSTNYQSGYNAGLVAGKSSVYGQFVVNNAGIRNYQRSNTFTFSAPYAGLFMMYGAVTYMYNNAGGSLNITTTGTATMNAVTWPGRDTLTGTFAYVAYLQPGQTITGNAQSEGAGQDISYSVIRLNY